MSVWTDIALANLQRQRPPPNDVDVDEGEELFICTGCGQSKPEHAYYTFYSKKADRVIRRAECRICINTRELERKRAKRALVPSPIPRRDRVLAALTESPLSLRKISTAAGMHRDVAENILSDLIAEGIAEFAGLVVRGMNQPTKTYRLAVKCNST